MIEPSKEDYFEKLRKAVRQAGLNRSLDPHAHPKRWRELKGAVASRLVHTSIHFNIGSDCRAVAVYYGRRKNRRTPSVSSSYVDRSEYIDLREPLERQLRDIGMTKSEEHQPLSKEERQEVLTQIVDNALEEHEVSLLVLTQRLPDGNYAVERYSSQ